MENCLIKMKISDIDILIKKLKKVEKSLLIILLAPKYDKLKICLQFSSFYQDSRWLGTTQVDNIVLFSKLLS